MATGSRPQSVKGKGREIFFGQEASPAVAGQGTSSIPLPGPETMISTPPSPQPAPPPVPADDGFDRVTLYIRSDQSLKLDTIKNRLKVRRKQKGMAPRAMAVDRSSIARLAIDLLDEHDIEDLLRRLES